MAKVKHIQIDNTPTEWEANAIYFVRNTGQIWQTDSNGLAVLMGVDSAQYIELIGNRLAISTDNVGNYYNTHFYYGKSGSAYTYGVSEDYYNGGIWYGAVQGIIREDEVRLRSAQILFSNLIGKEDMQLTINAERINENGYKVAQYELARINLSEFSPGVRKAFSFDFDSQFILQKNDTIIYFIQRFQNTTDATAIARGMYGMLKIDK